MMCEIPSNALLAQFLQYFDGFSIGSNDLTQLTLGLDRDSSLVANSFDERNEAVKVLLSMAINACNRLGKCGHLRPGTVRPSGFCFMVDAARHPKHVAESGYVAGYLGDAGKTERLTSFHRSWVFITASNASEALMNGRFKPMTEVMNARVLVKCLFILT